MTPCTRHHHDDYVAARDPKRPGWFTVSCGRCGQWLGSHPEEIERSSRPGQGTIEGKKRRKAG